MKRVKIGLLGLGTVGNAVFQEICSHGEWLEGRSGIRLEVARILVRNPSKVRDKAAEPLLTLDPDAVIRDPGIQVIVEVMGGYRPALDYVVEALQRGKQVVTANKELLSNAWGDLLRAAETGGGGIFYEASVAGAIPIIGPMRSTLVANRVGRIAGILNGTTNFILTQMTRQRMDFPEALAEAQRLGYAEADPSADVDGLDAARKVAILTTLAAGGPVYQSQVLTRGIRQVRAADVQFARERGFSLKLVAGALVVHESKPKVRAWVEPALLPEGHPLASVDNALNAVWLAGEPCGELFFRGQGAGGAPTSSSVMGDIVAAARASVGDLRPDAVCGSAEVIVEQEDEICTWYVRGPGLGEKRFRELAADCGVEPEGVEVKAGHAFCLTFPCPRSKVWELACRVNGFFARLEGQ
ncbi:MAG: homoserine dehydrogenase [Bacillota bacterium]